MLRVANAALSVGVDLCVMGSRTRAGGGTRVDYVAEMGVISSLPAVRILV